jgi:hypothetical protein
VLAWYSRETGKLQPLPGADDPQFVQACAFWSPDGSYLVFSRAKARDPYPPGQPPSRFANDPNETQIQYDLRGADSQSAASRLLGTRFGARPAGVPMSRDAAGTSAGATYPSEFYVKLFLREP